MKGRDYSLLPMDFCVKGKSRTVTLLLLYGNNVSGRTKVVQI